VATPIWEKGRGTAQSIRQGFTPEEEALYGEQVARMGEVAMQVGARGVAPEKVAEVIGHAMTARRPKTRYLVGTDTRAMVLVRRLLPDRITDRLVARATGL
jgi:hypothetical protein